MMIGHITISGLEKDGPPASLSPAMIDGLLRRDMNFGGLVMTDDLDMGAILNHYGFDETMRMGLAAGNDMLMICHRVELAAQAKQVIEALPAAAVEPAQERMANFKSKLVPPDPFSEEAFRVVDAEIWDLRVATLGAELAAQRSAEDGKRSPVELY
jgi:beta-N-acetylhexosaminidase